MNHLEFLPSELLAKIFLGDNETKLEYLLINRRIAAIAADAICKQWELQREEDGHKMRMRIFTFIRGYCAFFRVAIYRVCSWGYLVIEFPLPKRVDGKQCTTFELVQCAAECKRTVDRSLLNCDTHKCDVKTQTLLPLIWNSNEIDWNRHKRNLRGWSQGWGWLTFACRAYIEQEPLYAVSEIISFFFHPAIANEFLGSPDLRLESSAVWFDRKSAAYLGARGFAPNTVVVREMIESDPAEVARCLHTLPAFFSCHHNPMKKSGCTLLYLCERLDAETVFLYALRERYPEDIIRKTLFSYPQIFSRKKRVVSFERWALDCLHMAIDKRYSAPFIAEFIEISGLTLTEHQLINIMREKIPDGVRFALLDSLPNFRAFDSLLYVLLGVGASETCILQILKRANEKDLIYVSLIARAMEKRYKEESLLGFIDCFKKRFFSEHLLDKSLSYGYSEAVSIKLMESGSEKCDYRGLSRAFLHSRQHGALHYLLKGIPASSLPQILLQLMMDRVDERHIKPHFSRCSFVIDGPYFVHCLTAGYSVKFIKQLMRTLDTKSIDNREAAVISNYLMGRYPQLHPRLLSYLLDKGVPLGEDILLTAIYRPGHSESLLDRIVDQLDRLENSNIVYGAIYVRRCSSELSDKIRAKTAFSLNFLHFFCLDSYRRPQVAMSRLTSYLPRFSS